MKQVKSRSVYWLVSLVFLLSACESSPSKPVVNDGLTTLGEGIDIYQEELKKRKETERKIQEIKALNKKEELVSDQYRFDVNADKLDARLFFMNLMAGTGKNIVLHPDVSGKISLILSQVTLLEVLNVIREIHGYDYKHKDAIYTVFPNSLRTEIYPINYIDVKRIGMSDTSVLTGNVESSAQAGGQSTDQSSSLSEDGGSINPGSRIQTRSETDFWRSLNETLSELIQKDTSTTEAVDSPAAQRKVITNSHTGVAIVTAMPNELAAVRRFLDATRLSVKRQVIIEAKILEVQLSKNHQTGVNWDSINGQLLLGRNVSTFDSGVSIEEISEGVGEVFSSLLRISDIGTLLSLLETQGELQVLSSPRVSTVNNQKAVIRVGTDQFFVTGISNSTISNASSTTSSPDIELSSFFSGISLDVTPQISDEGDVILHIHPVISTVTEEQKNIVVGDSAFSLPLALRDIRESDSIVKAKSGQVIVLGGLMQERLNAVKGKRPGLSSIPLAGRLFNSTSDARIKSELIILLKATVVEQDSWVDDFKTTQDRFKKLTQPLTVQ
ncbi:MAG: MSHA biogenesis protein MshL [Candidatus Endobugula sp.]